MKGKGDRPFAAVALVIFVAWAGFAATFHFKFSSAGEFPGAFETIPLSSNLSEIVGYYNISPGGQFGYVQPHIEKSQTPFLNLQPPSGWFSFASGINNHGVVVGGYCMPPQQCNFPETMHGFSYSNGMYTTIDYPGAKSTGAYGINDLGQIVGGYCDSASTCGQSQIATQHGFLKSNGTFMELGYPGAIATQANAINKAGVIVGVYEAMDGKPHSFLYQNGRYKNFDFPGARSTHASAINNNGVMAGYYELDSSQVLGFVYKGGQFYTVSYSYKTNTGLTGINDAGVVVGTYDGPHGLPLTFKAVSVK